jgi:hypothetical protein
MSDCECDRCYERNKHTKSKDSECDRYNYEKHKYSKSRDCDCRKCYNRCKPIKCKHGCSCRKCNKEYSCSDNHCYHYVCYCSCVQKPEYKPDCQSCSQLLMDKNDRSSTNNENIIIIMKS